VTRRQIELLHRLVEELAPRSVTLAGRWRLRLAGGRLWLEPPSPPEPYEHRLDEGGVIELSIPGWRVRLTRDAAPSPGARWHWRAAGSSRLTVRTARPGDSVAIGVGTAGASRLIARVAPRHLRPGWPLLCENAKLRGFRRLAGDLVRGPAGGGADGWMSLGSSSRPTKSAAASPRISGLPGEAHLVGILKGPAFLLADLAG
jgi:hypothetical protein